MATASRTLEPASAHVFASGRTGRPGQSPLLEEVMNQRLDGDRRFILMKHLGVRTSACGREGTGGLTADFTDDELQRLIDACLRDLGRSDHWHDPDGYPHGLALCVIDAIFSIGVSYQGVINVVNRYRAVRQSQSGDADRDGIAELTGTFEHAESPEQWADMVENHQRTSTRSGILKSDAVLREAHVLAAHHIWTVADLHHAALHGRLAEVQSDWTKVPGQRSGVSWSYFLILARPQRDNGDSDGGAGPNWSAPGPTGPGPVPDLPTRYADAVMGVKPDRMIVRYVAAALGVAEGALAPKKAADLVRGAARKQGWDVFSLDHAVWRFQSNRPHTRP